MSGPAVPPRQGDGASPAHGAATAPAVTGFRVPFGGGAPDHVHVRDPTGGTCGRESE